MVVLPVIWSDIPLPTSTKGGSLPEGAKLSAFPRLPLIHVGRPLPLSVCAVISKPRKVGGNRVRAFVEGPVANEAEVVGGFYGE